MNSKDLESVMEDTILFDNPGDLTTSGNEDLLDSIKSICLDCCGVNGAHAPDCGVELLQEVYDDVPA